MTDRIHEITRGLEFMAFEAVQDYVAEHIDYDGRNLFRAKQHWKLLDPTHIENVRRLYNNDAGFPAFLEDLQLQDIRNMDAALHEGLKTWGQDGRMIAIARNTGSGKFELLPKSLWVFAGIDLKTGAISLEGEQRFDAPKFLLAEFIPNNHAIFEHVTLVNDPASAGLSEDEAPEVPVTALPAPMGSGLPGRPTSRHLIETEFERRKEGGTLAPSLNKEAKALSVWLADTHPKAPRASPKTIANHIREAWRNAGTGPATRDSKPTPK